MNKSRAYPYVFIIKMITRTQQGVGDSLADAEQE